MDSAVTPRPLFDYRTMFALEHSDLVAGPGTPVTASRVRAVVRRGRAHTERDLIRIAGGINRARAADVPT